MLRRKTMNKIGLASVLLVFVFGGVAQAMIDTEFTPIELVQQSEAIVLVEFAKPKDDGEAVAKVVEAYKGKAPAKEIKFFLMAGQQGENPKGKRIISDVSGPHKQALLFLGEFDKFRPPHATDEPMALLHVGKEWVVLLGYQDEEDPNAPIEWDMADTSNPLLAVFSGSDPMLRRAVKYILNNKDAKVPTTSEVHWAKKVQLGKVDVKVNGVTGLRLGEANLVFLSSADGDRLITLADGKGTDVTAEYNLTSKSLASEWADFDGNDGLDLLSWDGKGLKLFATKDGKFTEGEALPAEGLKDVQNIALVAKTGSNCLAVIGTPTGPMLFDGKTGIAAMAKPEKFDELGKGGKVLAADFDADGVNDILAVYEKGSVFYKGVEGEWGKFAAPQLGNVARGEGRGTAIVGDYDMDGLFDLFVTAEDRNRLYHNVGEGKFDEMLALSGEIEYIAKRGGIEAITGDINNDGRQDIFIAYSGFAPHVFFNRGFFSFGHAHGLDVADNRLIEGAQNGQQGGTLTDLNGDGALDMVVVLTDGSVWMLPRQVEDDTALAIKVTSPTVQRVTAANESRQFGAFKALPGRPALVGVREAQPVTVSWKKPGQDKPETKLIFVAGECQELCLPPAASTPTTTSK
jgi:hypothetical protein